MTTHPNTSRRRQVETPEYAAMVRRMIRAHGRRVAEADPEDLVELLELQVELNAAVATAVAGQRHRGASWGVLGAALGITRQAAQQRYAGVSVPQNGDDQ